MSASPRPGEPGDTKGSNDMVELFDERLLPLAVWLQLTMAGVRRRAVEAWRDRNDESGIDEAVTKMIWLAVGIGVAVAAGAFFIGVFDSAKSNVPDPVAP